MPNQTGELEEALDKLASVLGLIRGHSTQNEFWIPLAIPDDSVLQQLKFLRDDVRALQATCYNLQQALKSKRDR